MLATVLTISVFALSMMFTMLLLNHSRPRVSDGSLWSFVTTYLLLSSLVFLIISIVELFEFLSDFRILTFEVPNLEAYLYVVMPLSFAIHVYAIYRLSTLVEFRVENVDPNRIGLPVVYVSIFWLLSIELPEFGRVAYDIVLLSEFVYILSLPVVAAIIYLTLREKRIEHAIIQLPMESIDRLSGISLSIALFSLAVFMNVHSYHLVYDQLEAFSLIVFIVSGELYRRNLFRMMKIIG
ncbi:hypothetical protein GAH_00643 [Geoglobus ahangari]|uniref:Uncharacterized protein n=1 Tax=Geoglobus ahangari TaxID=113653 RepID=A0A0F7IH75_9EURY|nr:hypothetical protein [Geoglobus ahangari]AKG92018.1 hypothetical protein GAH_00643 [Geoglobus ahangari]